MSQWVENCTERAVMWLLVLLPEQTLIHCHYHLASTHIRCKHRFVTVEHPTRAF
jgi:hypothetical protein